jgi:hypothetical protein
MQKARQAAGSYARSDELDALTELLAEEAAMITADVPAQRRSKPLPQLDWPADLFDDAVTN